MIITKKKYVYIVLLFFIILSLIFTKTIGGFVYHTYQILINKKMKYKIKKIIDTEKKYKIPEIESSTKSVPKIIFQTHENIDLIPKKYIQDLKNLNKEWDYRFFNKKDREDFMLKEYGQVFLDKMNSFTKGAHKADLWRLCVLYKYGGCYMDADLELHIPLEKILDNCSEDLIIPKTKIYFNYTRVFNAMIICKPGNHLIKECISNILHVQDEDLMKNYHYIIELMGEILKNNLKHELIEVYKPRKIINLFPSPEDYYITLNNETIAKSKRDDYKIK